MDRIRALGLIAATALLAGACGSAAPSAAPPSQSGGAASAAAPEAPSAASEAPSSTTSAGGAPVELRWYCCLGGGEAPEQKKVEDKVVADWNAAHPDIHVTFEVVTYEGNVANETLATELQAGNGPDVVGPVGIGGANAFKGQGLPPPPPTPKNNSHLRAFPQTAG